MKNNNMKTLLLAALVGMVTLLGACKKTVEEVARIAPEPPGINSNGQVRADVDWPDVYSDPLKADYEIRNNVVIEDNVMVRVAPGVIIKFTGVNAGITVNNGALVAAGTVTQPICFDGSSEARGSWLGIRFHTNNPANTLKHCKVRYAGADGKGAVQVTSILDDRYPSFCDISNCEISQSASYGLYMDKSTSINFADNKVISNTGSPVRMTTMQLDRLDAASNYSNNAAGTIEVVGSGVLDGAGVTVPKLSVPYLVSSGAIEVKGAQLVVSPGVEMRFKSGTRIELRTDGAGSIYAVGTAANRITFKGQQAGKGGWDGIAIYGPSTANIFSYCTIDGGGQNAMGLMASGSAGRANIVVGNSTNYCTADIQNCVISNSLGAGIWVGSLGTNLPNIPPGSLNTNVEDAGVNTFTNVSPNVAR
jgi:hypothetical protein